MRNSPFWFLIIGAMLLIDIYVFQAVKFLSHGAAHRTRTTLFALYWIISIASVLLTLFWPMLALAKANKDMMGIIFSLIIGLFFGKLLIAVFMLIDDGRRGIQWLAGKLFENPMPATAEGRGITRSHFLTWAGVGVGSTIFGSMIVGFFNKYRYTVHRVSIPFSNVPQSFKGLKIAQLSDIHCGSFKDIKAVGRGVEKVLALKPDIILFTGDLVNNEAVEMDKYIDVFSRLKAPMGVYSILGNHDYGDYLEWKTPQEKVANLNRLKAIHKQMGWRLLLNENVELERGGEKIGLLGVENWSNRARFPKYGKLDQAYAGSETLPFKILMSHDPSHWEGQVLGGYKDIDLTLSGHTHGMQYGVELPWFRWSPVQYVYQRWAGLYTEGRQHLYVNRGFGFIGYPGRVGILPEITLIELA